MRSPRSEDAGMGERAFVKQHARSGTQTTQGTMLRRKGGITQRKPAAFSARRTQNKDTHKNHAPQQDGMVNHSG